MLKKIRAQKNRLLYKAYRHMEEDKREPIFDMFECNTCSTLVPVYLTHDVTQATFHCEEHGDEVLTVVILDLDEVEAHQLLHL